MEFKLNKGHFGSNYIGKVRKNANWYISYNPFTFDGHEETALVIQDSLALFGVNYAILEGDFRNEYKKCKTLKEALKIYIKFYDEHANFWTNVSKEVAIKYLEEK